MKIKFIGVPGEPEHQSLNMYGTQFELNKSVEVKDKAIAKRLQGHPHFEVQDDVEDAEFKELRHDYRHDGAAQLADKTANYEIATAEVQGKEPAPNAKEGLAEDLSEPTVEELRTQAEALGIDVDKRWKEERLKSEIEKASK